MLLTVAADERAAMQFDEVASALDAGLPIESLGGDPKAGERVVHSLLQKRKVKLSATEDAVLTAAWAAGRVSNALRRRAEQRRQRATFSREIWAALRYPTVLIGLALLLSLIATRITGYGLLIGVTTGLVTIAAAIYFVRRGILTGDDKWQRLPWIGPLGSALGELPYLETLHALYSSGVPIIEAHATATGSVATASLRIRLRKAEQLLRAGSTLRESLEQSGALLEETRTLLGPGEASGQLEDALERALVRRREVTARDVKTTARWATAIAYGTGIAVAVTFILIQLRQLSAQMGR